MRELPIFPLEVVLFPRQVLPLHIFEQRYRIMIRSCIENSEPFGVVLTSHQLSDAVYGIGTTARIVEVENLPDGRMNIVTIGEQRFKILNVRVSEHGYLIAQVLDAPLEVGSPDEESLARSLRKFVRRYIELLTKTKRIRLERVEVPTAPMDLALFTAVILQASLEDKQLLLAQDRLSDLLFAERAYLEYEFQLIRVVESAVRPPEGIASFSVN
ncbi:MAG: LON peptidase substrate-binding domain-containing protein [Anaerolineae bacterium]|nr:LON peptidase substrate-binding domain-containing protein [Thermoflexales bacterium]MDW8395518.1 LON peptidase substrate-binding domain-containing protein [Anaerolineae bacterium]